MPEKWQELSFLSSRNSVRSRLSSSSIFLSRHIFPRSGSSSLQSHRKLTHISVTFSVFITSDKRVAETFFALVWWPQLSFSNCCLQTSSDFQESFEPTQRQKLEMTDSKIYWQFSLHITHLSASDSLFQLRFLSFFSFVLRQHLTLWEADEPQEVQQLDRGEHQHHDAHRLQPLRLPDCVQHCSTLGPLLATIPRPEPGAWAGLLALGAARTSAPSRPCTPVPLHQLQRYTGPHARAGRSLAPAYCPLAPQIQSG